MDRSSAYPPLQAIGLACFLSAAACQSDTTFSSPGSLSADSGRDSFRFGAATTAIQIEDGLVNSDWYHWSRPEAEGGRGQGEAFVGDAVMGYTRAIEDAQLIADLGLDAYRFNVDWSRVEPEIDAVSEEALAHYGALIDALLGHDVQPMLTVHHFSSPLWVHNFMLGDCSDAQMPSDENLCGWGHPQGAERIIEELAEHAARLAREYGDRVDEWCTLNEPINYLIASYGGGQFPPGQVYLLGNFERLMTVYRNYLRAHVAIYDAIKANDLVDADGDGEAASIGLSLNSIKWVPASDNEPSEARRDLEARDRIWYLYHHFYPDALINGTYDADLDAVPDEVHPDWKGKLDWLGIQYYSRNGVTGSPAMFPGVEATLCVADLDMGACLPPDDTTHWVPTMRYEYYAPGIYDVLKDVGQRYEGLPLVVTESGLATNEGRRRAEHIVRTLEQVHLARESGVDVRGYYHWSLMDNFEWSEGFWPRFGLYHVDFNTYERTATEGAEVYREIITGRALTAEHSEVYGGLGPMTPEPEVDHHE